MLIRWQQQLLSVQVQDELWHANAIPVLFQSKATCSVVIIKSPFSRVLWQKAPPPSRNLDILENTWEGGGGSFNIILPCLSQ